MVDMPFDGSSPLGESAHDMERNPQTFSDPLTAMESYKHLHRTHPGRELYVVHTDKEVLDITERKWLGIRGMA